MYQTKYIRRSYATQLARAIDDTVSLAGELDVRGFSYGSVEIPSTVSQTTLNYYGCSVSGGEGTCLRGRPAVFD